MISFRSCCRTFTDRWKNGGLRTDLAINHVDVPICSPNAERRPRWSSRRARRSSRRRSNEMPEPPETTELALAPPRHNLEWRLAFCHRVGVGLAGFGCHRPYARIVTARARAQRAAMWRGRGHSKGQCTGYA
jgi:hypothetical protein